MVESTAQELVEGEPLCILEGGCKLVEPLCSTWEVSPQIDRASMWSSCSTGYLYKRNKISLFKCCLHFHVHCNTILKSNTDSIKICIRGPPDKGTMQYFSDLEVLRTTEASRILGTTSMNVRHLIIKWN